MNYFVYFSILNLILTLIKSHSGKGCGAHLLKQKRELVKTGTEESKRTILEQSYQPIRIHLDYSFIESKKENFSDNDIIDLKEKIMPKALQVLQSLLQLKRFSGPLLLNTTKCDNLLYLRFIHLREVV